MDSIIIMRHSTVAAGELPAHQLPVRLRVGARHGPGHAAGRGVQHLRLRPHPGHPGHRPRPRPCVPHGHEVTMTTKNSLKSLSVRKLLDKSAFAYWGVPLGPSWSFWFLLGHFEFAGNLTNKGAMF